jgi:hypothetical protein
MTTLLVKFDAQKVGGGGGVMARRQLRDIGEEGKQMDDGQEHAT